MENEKNTDKIEKEAITYTVPQVAELLNLSERTIYRHINDKKLRAVKVAGSWRIRHIDYIDFLDNLESNM